MPKIELSIDVREAQRDLERLAARIGNPVRLMKNWGVESSKSLKSDARSNIPASTGPGKRFRIDMERSIQLESVSAFSVNIMADYRAVHRQRGGTIRPTKKRMLTIPIGKALKSGKSAGDYESEGKELFVIPSDDKKYALLGYSSGKRKKFEPLFLLARESKQEARPWANLDILAKIGVREALKLIEKEAAQ